MHVHTSGALLMSAAPQRRWPLLLRADWPRFFRRCPKTHRERRWWGCLLVILTMATLNYGHTKLWLLTMACPRWGCLLAANRRIFLVHALGFGLAISVLLARCAGTQAPSGVCASVDVHAGSFNGWGWMRVLPALTLLAPLCTCLGRGFEMWAGRTSRTTADWRVPLL